MASKSTALENYYMQYYLEHGVTTITIAYPLTVALLKSAPGDSTQPVDDEVSTTVDDTAYARQTITFSNITTETRMPNSNTITFPACVYGTGAAPYVVTTVAIIDANDVWLYKATLNTSITVNAGDTVTFQPGDLIVGERDKEDVYAISQLKLALRGDTSGPIQPPTKWYVGLLSDDVEIDSVNYSSTYSRQEVVWNSVGTSWRTDNALDIVFPAAKLVGESANNGVFQINGVGLYDSQSGGNLIVKDGYAALSIYQDMELTFTGNNNSIRLGED